MSEKIPANCIRCREPLSRSDMQFWVELCDRNNKDPIEEAKKGPEFGISCQSCFIRVLVDASEDSESPIHEDSKKLIRGMRAEHLGIKIVK